MPKQGPSLKSSLLSLYIQSFPTHLLSASSSAHTVNYLTLPFDLQRLQQTIWLSKPRSSCRENMIEKQPADLTSIQNNLNRLICIVNRLYGLRYTLNDNKKPMNRSQQNESWLLSKFWKSRIRKRWSNIEADLNSRSPFWWDMISNRLTIVFDSRFSWRSSKRVTIGLLHLLSKSLE